jgi:hypothetical protein
VKNQTEYRYPVIVLASVLIFLNWGCKKEDPPTLTTLPVTEITGHSAQSGGSITDDGGASVSLRGIVWSTSENPTINHNESLTSDGAGAGQFISSLAGLTPGTKYFIRAYAENSAGIAYGNQLQFTTVDPATDSGLATVTTEEVSEVTQTSARSGGNVTDDGGSDIISRGVVWSTSENPDLDNNGGFTTDGSGPGAFTSVLEGLLPATTYYVRAYATNSTGTSYGESVDFTTGSPVRATVMTARVSEITPASARSGGNVTDDGGSEIISRGVVWNTSENPDLDNNGGFTTDGSGPAAFTSVLEGLLPATTYYVRAYATNSTGTSYGESVDFKTRSGERCDFFYYYQGKPRYLGYLSNDYILVAFDTVYSDPEVKEYISTLSFMDQNYDYKIHQYPDYKSRLVPLRFASPKNCEEITGIISGLHKNPMVTYAHYTMQTDYCTDDVWQPIGNLCVDSYSSFFYVRVPNENDLTDLHNMISETNTEFVEQNMFMKNWFTLRATKNSDGDALMMANCFYESGLFDAIAVDFLKYPVE